MKTSNREVIVVTFNNERKNAKCIRAAFLRSSRVLNLCKNTTAVIMLAAVGC